MKALKIAVSVLMCIAMLAFACACKETPPPDETQTQVYHTVSFLTNGSAIEPIKVADGGKIEKPQTPTREGYVFNGWSCEGRSWDFESGKVSADITLVAEWLAADRVYSFEVTPDGVCITAVTKKLGEMSVPATINGIRVVAIGEAAFADLSASDVTSITLADSITSIGAEAFAGCEGIEITVSGSLTYIGESAFSECNRLRAITFGQGLKAIPYRAFAGCAALSVVRFPSTLELIDENAFEDCTSLRTVLLYPTTARISDDAFGGCDALSKLCFMGSAEQFRAVAVEGLNSEFKQATVCYYSEIEPALDGEYFYLDSNGNIKFW
jgi:uncharacterized repeat protein (TIGR02543 family)